MLRDTSRLRVLAVMLKQRLAAAKAFAVAKRSSEAAKEIAQAEILAAEALAIAGSDDARESRKLPSLRRKSGTGAKRKPATKAKARR